MPCSRWSYSMPVSARNSRSAARLYCEMFAMSRMLRRTRDGRHSSRNCVPQAHWRGSMRRRKSSGASSRQIRLRIFSGASGLAHGSACEAEIWPPFANEVSRPGPVRRSMTVTSCPRLERYHAVAVPITPAPRTSAFMAGGVWGFGLDLSTRQSLSGAAPANPTCQAMRPRLYADLLGFLRAACTHASHSGRELPVLPFYVKEHAVGWLRPSFAELLRRWPHLFEVDQAFVTLRASPDTAQGRTAAMAEVARELARDGVIRGWRDEQVSISHH